jgi:hypothetical protein
LFQRDKRSLYGKKVADFNSLLDLLRPEARTKKPGSADFADDADFLNSHRRNLRISPPKPGALVPAAYGLALSLDAAG